jgi:hypothetical protein
MACLSTAALGVLDASMATAELKKAPRTLVAGLRSHWFEMRNLESSIHHARESSDKPILNAFWRVAPSVRFRLLAILPAGVFFRASDFNSRTCRNVHARLFDTFFKMLNLHLLEEAVLYLIVFYKESPAQRRWRARDRRAARRGCTVPRSSARC